MPGWGPIRAGMRDRMSGAGGAGGELHQTLSRLERRFRSTGLRAPRNYPAVLSDAGRSCGCHEPGPGCWSFDLLVNYFF
eukprot:2087200-Prymnesium_polylepis.2